MMTKRPLTLGSLPLQSMNPIELAQMRHVLKNTTLPKIVEDQRQHARNVRRVRDQVAYGSPLLR